MDFNRQLKGYAPQMKFGLKNIGFITNIVFLEPFSKLSPYALEGKPIFGFVHNHDLGNLLAFLKNGFLRRIPLRWSLDSDNDPWTCGYLDRSFINSPFFAFTPDPNVIFIDEAYDTASDSDFLLESCPDSPYQYE